jgi:hypothetical protein
MTINETIEVVLKRLTQITHNIKSIRRSQNQNGSTKWVLSECRQYFGFCTWTGLTEKTGIIITAKHEWSSA